MSGTTKKYYVTGTEYISSVQATKNFTFEYNEEYIQLLTGIVPPYGISFWKPVTPNFVDDTWGLPLRQFFDMEREYKRAVGAGQIDPQEMQEWQEVTYTRTRKLHGASTSAKSTTVSPSPWHPIWKRPHDSDSLPGTSNAG